MKPINTRTHGIIDYVAGTAIAMSPFMLKFNKKEIESIVPIAAGSSAIVYSLFTDYEMGAVKKIPMRTHLAIDLASGILLAASPWLFGFSKKTFLPHLIMGTFEIVAALTTRSATGK